MPLATRWIAILLIPCLFAGFSQSEICVGSTKDLEGDYAQTFSGTGYSILVALGIHGSSYVYETTTIRGKWKDYTIHKYAICRVRDDYFMLTEKSYDSYQIDEKGNIDRRFGSKITAMPRTDIKTIKVSQDSLAEHFASIYTGNGPNIQGRWVYKYDYRRDSASTPESTVVEIGGKETVVFISSGRLTTTYASSISNDTLSWRDKGDKDGKGGKSKLSYKYRVGRDSLFMECLSPLMGYKRRLPGG